MTALGNYFAGARSRGPFADRGGPLRGRRSFHDATKNHPARYRVADPADKSVNYMTTAELQSFITTAPNGGFALSAWEEAAAAAAAAGAAVV